MLSMAGTSLLGHASTTYCILYFCCFVVCFHWCFQVSGFCVCTLTKKMSGLGVILVAVSTRNCRLLGDASILQAFRNSGQAAGYTSVFVPDTSSQHAAYTDSHLNLMLQVPKHFVSPPSAELRQSSHFTPHVYQAHLAALPREPSATL